jgi:hypothetical protein
MRITDDSTGVKAGLAVSTEVPEDAPRESLSSSPPRSSGGSQALFQNLAGVERDCGPTAASVCIGGIGAACFDLLALGPQSRSLADAGF